MQKQTYLALGMTIAHATSLLQSQFLSAQAPPLPIKPDVPYVPTPKGGVMGMLKLGVTANDVLYGLGFGDGRLVITAQKIGAKRGIGVEINSGLVNLSNENARQAGVSDRVQFIQ